MEYVYQKDAEYVDSLPRHVIDNKEIVTKFQIKKTDNYGKCDFGDESMVYDPSQSQSTQPEITNQPEAVYTANQEQGQIEAPQYYAEQTYTNGYQPEVYYDGSNQTQTQGYYADQNYTYSDADQQEQEVYYYQPQAYQAQAQSQYYAAQPQAYQAQAQSQYYAAQPQAYQAQAQSQYYAAPAPIETSVKYAPDESTSLSEKL